MDTVSPSAQEGKQNPETTFIYALLDPETKEIRYVGKADNPQLRLKQHIVERKAHGQHKMNWVASLARRGLVPEMQIIEETPYEGWQERERYWIAFYRAQGVKLVNNTDGGESNSGMVVSAETRAKQSALRRGKKRPPEVGAKTGASQKGKKISAETRAKQSARAKERKPHPNALAALAKNTEEAKGKPRPPEVIAKIRATRMAKGWISDEARARLRMRTLSDERKEKFRTFAKQPRSAEHRESLSKAAIAKYAKMKGLTIEEYMEFRAKRKRKRSHTRNKPEVISQGSLWSEMAVMGNRPLPAVKDS